MITQLLADILPPAASNEGLATMLDTNPAVVTAVVEENSICVCKCAYRENVFSEVGAIVDWNKNDKTTLLFKKAISGDSITIVLIGGTGSPHTITDDTYGTYYNGTLTGQPLYIGFVVDWNKIYNVLGTGTYSFEITTTIIGATTVLETIDYYLQPYSDRQADGTIRVETYNSGTIVSSDFDYDGILEGGWYQSFRIKGKLSKTPKLITDNYIDQDNNILQIQDKITNEYELELGLIPASIADVLIYDNLLANKIQLSDYNVFNENVFRRVEVIPTDIEKKTFPWNKEVQFTIKFTSAKDNIIKNNF